MADNVAITAGSGTTIAADDVGGALHQRVKVSIGADGSATDWPVNSGNVGATVPRVTLATDDAAIALLNTSLTDKSQFTKITDGADTLLINANGAALAQLADSTGAEITFEPSVAHDAADSGNPFKIGLKATTSLSS